MVVVTESNLPNLPSGTGHNPTNCIPYFSWGEDSARFSDAATDFGCSRAFPK